MEKRALSLADKLKRLREAHGVSLRDLEAETAISNAYLSQLETGKIENPGVITLLKLAEYYRVKLSWLVGAD
jgi:HTH-type transcriptional regulator, competence development regulator